MPIPGQQPGKPILSKAEEAMRGSGDEEESMRIIRHAREYHGEMMRGYQRTLQQEEPRLGKLYDILFGSEPVDVRNDPDLADVQEVMAYVKDHRGGKIPNGSETMRLVSEMEQLVRVTHIRA